MSITLSMVFKVCTKNQARKAAQAEWVMWTPRIFGVGQQIFVVGLKFYVSQMEV